MSYKIIDKKKFELINQKKVATKVGITPATLNRIINNKQATSKATAYCIVKIIDSNAELSDYFVEIEEQ